MRRLLSAAARAALVVDQRLDRPVARNRRGVAMLLVMFTVTILATSIVEFVYNTRVNLYLAQNHRDEVKAYFLARSGINLQRLALAYQYEIARDPNMGLLASVMSRSNFQMFRFLPYLAPIFTSGQLSAGDFGEVDLGRSGASGFGGFQGNIVMHDVEAETGKINVNLFASQRLDQEAIQRLCQLVFPGEYDSMMGIEQQRTIEDRFEVVAAIVDYVDPDSDLTVLDENCVASVGGAGNEISRYVDTDVEPKNEPLVSLDELRLVPGVTDGFMTQFGDHLTVYPIANKQMYVNEADFETWYAFLCSHIQGLQEDVGFSACVLPQVQLRVVYDALVLSGYVALFDDPIRVLMLMMGGSDVTGEVLGGGRFMPFSSNARVVGTMQGLLDGSPELHLFLMSFAEPRWVQAYGLTASIGQGSLVPPQRPFEYDLGRMARDVETSNPEIFTIRSTGEYGAASRTITAVTDLSAYPQTRTERILYWREF
ncbi:MAG: general secretion pathway protein GspK [Myxococcales bacterium]|nr:general secretion pathway protein GspK [Myxococcales bacterium]MCB9520050.1 general secretion pathway protein GspK [Myxococcales bacterium]